MIKYSFEYGKAPKEELEKIAEEFDDKNLVVLAKDLENKLSSRLSLVSNRTIKYRNSILDTLTLLEVCKEFGEVTEETDELKLKELNALDKEKYDTALETIYFMRKELKMKV